MVETDESETRFKALIQPIRDLASNWDVDIAEELDEYLEELDHIRISLDQGHSHLNFAEAALLIQGSTAIYSKKVEYLHQLVLQALELISSHNKTKNPQVQAAKKVTTSYLDDERLLFGADADFLLLDDIVEEGANIDLEIKRANNLMGKRRSSGRLSVSGDASKTSMILMHSLLHEDHGGANLKLSSCHVDVSGALLIGGFNPTGHSEVQESHRNRFDVDKFGSIIVDNNDEGDGWHNDSHDIGLYQYDGDAHLAGDGHDSLHEGMDIHEGFDDAGFDAVVYPPDDFDDGVDNAPSILADDSDSRIPARHALTLLDPHEVTIGSRPMKKGKTFKIPTSLRPRENSSQGRNNANKATVSERNKIATEVMTPGFVFYNLVMRAKIPTSGLAHMHFDHILKEELKKVRIAKRKEKKLGGIQSDGHFLYRDPTDEAAPFVSRTARRSANSATITGVGDDDMEEEHNLYDDANLDDFWADDEMGGYYESTGGGAVGPQGFGDEDGFRLAGEDEIGTHNRVGGSSLSQEGYGEGSLGSGGDDARVAFVNADGDGYTEEENVYHVDNDEEIAAALSGSLNARAAGFGGGSPGGRLLDPFSAMLEEEEQLARRVEEVLSEGLTQASNNSYEMLCRKHIENFMKGADQYARETQLSRRVGDWTRKLEPILRAQEVAPGFDIHEYSNRVLLAMSEVTSLSPETRGSDSKNALSADMADNQGGAGMGPMVGFEEIVKGQSSAEVCRVFLACLQLSNLGSVSVIQPPQLSDDDDGVDCDEGEGEGVVEEGEGITSTLHGSRNVDSGATGRVRGKRVGSDGRSTKPAAVGGRGGNGAGNDGAQYSGGSGITSARMTKQLLQPFKMVIVSSSSRMDVENFRAPSVLNLNGSGTGTGTDTQRDPSAASLAPDAPLTVTANELRSGGASSGIGSSTLSSSGSMGGGGGGMTAAARANGAVSTTLSERVQKGVKGRMNTGQGKLVTKSAQRTQNEIDAMPPAQSTQRVRKVIAKGRKGRKGEGDVSGDISAGNMSNGESDDDDADMDASDEDDYADDSDDSFSVGRKKAGGVSAYRRGQGGAQPQYMAVSGTDRRLGGRGSDDAARLRSRK